MRKHSASLGSSIGSTRSTEYFSPAFNSSRRVGSISSAVFNLVSTMVGGGVLSLPYAFYKAGIVAGLIILLITAVSADFTVYALVSCSRRTVHSHNTPESFEEVVFSAFGMKGKNFTMFLVFLTTYIAVIAYAILLRDIASPLAERAFNGGVKFDDFGRNVCMLLLVLMVTPLMFLRNMTALKPVAMVSMTTIGTLACCIAVRSYQCNFDDINSIDMGDSVVPKREESWQDYVVLFGERKGILDSLPIFICTFVCHFNVLPVHGELRKPTRKRLKKMIHITFLVTAFFYAFVGICGSMFGNCQPDGEVNGNILNNFENDDDLMTLGRAGLMCTITLAFPNLVMPCRDILFRALKTVLKNRRMEARGGVEDTFYDDCSDRQTISSSVASGVGVGVGGGGGVTFGEESLNDNSESMNAPLLKQSNRVDTYNNSNTNGISDVDKFVHTYTFGSDSDKFLTSEQQQKLKESKEKNERKRRLDKKLRTIVTLFVFWGGVFFSCFIKNVTVVWDILGSSISIIIAFIIPRSAYLVIRQPKKVRKERKEGEPTIGELNSVFCCVCEVKITPSENAIIGVGGRRCHASCMRAGSDIVQGGDHDLEKVERLRSLSNIDQGGRGGNGAGEDSLNYSAEGNHDLSIAGASPFGRARSVEVVTNKRRIMAYVVLGVYCPLLLICSTNALWNLLQ